MPETINLMKPPIRPELRPCKSAYGEFYGPAFFHGWFMGFHNDKPQPMAIVENEHGMIRYVTFSSIQFEDRAT